MSEPIRFDFTLTPADGEPVRGTRLIQADLPDLDPTMFVDLVGDAAWHEWMLAQRTAKAEP
jgi:hypothetical protein